MRVIVAARLSRKQRNGEQGIGIDTQDSRSRGWSEHEGHEVIQVIADTKSGTVAPWDRRNLRPWVTEPEKMARYDGIVAYKNDRLSRGCWADEARIRLWAQEHGKTLMIVDGPQWPPRHDGDKWAWEAQASQARKEWEDGRERSMRAQGELRDRQMLVGRTPFGFTSQGPKYHRVMVPTGQGRRLVPEIFARVIAGQSLAEIAMWLEAETGRTWWARTVGQLVRNPAYIGHRVDGSGRTILRCEPLVDAAIFRQAGRALDSKPKRGPQDAQDRALLAGVVFCPRCAGGSPMYRIRARNGVFYRCAGRGAHRKGCGNMVRVTKTDAAVHGFMAGLNEPVMVRTLIPGHDHGAEIEAVKFELRQLDPDAGDYDEQHARLRQDLAALRELPAVPDSWEDVPTGQTYAQRWAEQGNAERAAWMKSVGLSAWALNEHEMGDRIEIRDRDGQMLRTSFV